MGSNKRYINSKLSIQALEDHKLKNYYGKSDFLIFEDNLSLKIYNLFQEGRSDSEILLIINKNMEEKTNEVY